MPFPPVTTHIEGCFPVFDAWERACNLSSWNELHGLPPDEIVAIWQAKGDAAAKLGTALHEDIEAYFMDGSIGTSDAFDHFKRFIKKRGPFEKYRSEWRIFDEDLHVAGTIDFLANTPKGLVMYDWKRSTKVVDADGEVLDNNWKKYGYGACSEIPDTPFERYQLQQSLYATILERKYGVKVAKAYLVVLHPELPRWYRVKVRIDREVAGRMFL